MYLRKPFSYGQRSRCESISKECMWDTSLTVWFIVLNFHHSYFFYLPRKYISLPITHEIDLSSPHQVMHSENVTDHDLFQFLLSERRAESEFDTERTAIDLLTDFGRKHRSSSFPIILILSHPMLISFEHRRGVGPIRTISN